MEKATGTLQCPACSAGSLDLCRYESMMVVRPGFALFGLHCPSCGSSVSALQPIPAALQEEVRFAAIVAGARMGRE